MKPNRASMLQHRSGLASRAAAAARPIGAQTLTTNRDVVAISIGAFGPSAARTLIAEGKSIVVERAGRSFVAGEKAEDPYITFFCGAHMSKYCVDHDLASRHWSGSGE